jgi:hypothetical protein
MAVDSNPADTPLLLIAWRRPHTLRQVIDAIRPVAPTHLFVACDGPNPERPGEAEKVAATRAVIEHEIDWPCQIERLYSDVNQGCRLGVSRAITWFFEQVEEGVILEDDCVPHPDFFPYCAELLDRYRDDTRVWSVCGSNFQLGNKRGDASYYFSIHGDSWGWATWRRAWSFYEQAKIEWVAFRDSGQLDNVFPLSAERKYWGEALDKLFIDGQPDTWDYQWWLASWMNNGLHCWPNASLVSNHGFGDEATHTFRETDFSALPLEGIGILTHPAFIVPSREADEFSFMQRRAGAWIISQEAYSQMRNQYGVFLPWILRYRQMREEGGVAYASARLKRLMRFWGSR